MVMGNLAAITHGAAMVIPSAEFDPLATLQVSARFVSGGGLWFRLAVKFLDSDSRMKKDMGQVIAA
jgi:hypothetical protein